MIAQAMLLFVWLCSGSCTMAWAMAQTPVAAARHLRSTEGDSTNVTCAPVEVDGEIECEQTPPSLRWWGYSYYARLPNPEPVECQVGLITYGVDLPSECKELPGPPGLTRCTATVPRHLVNVTICEMVGYTDAIKPYIVTSRYRIDCKGECEVYTSSYTCAVNEDCRLCLQDFREYFPGSDRGRDLCEKVLP